MAVRESTLTAFFIMGIESTLPNDWFALAQACGGITNLHTTLGVPRATFFRLSRGLSPIGTDLREKIVALAESKGLKPPVAPEVPPEQRKLDDTDILILEQLGKALENERPVNRAFVTRMAKQMGTPALVRVAESEAPTRVHRAAAELLGL